MSIEGEWLMFLENNDVSNYNKSNDNVKNEYAKNEYVKNEYAKNDCLDHAKNDGIDDAKNDDHAFNRLNGSIINLQKMAIPKQDFDKNCSNIYISTKTKILFLNKSLDIFTTFWLLPITDYNKQEKGIIKKQIK